MIWPQRCFGGIRVMNAPSPANVRRLTQGIMPMLRRMTSNGMSIDVEALQQIDEDLAGEQSDLLFQIEGYRSEARQLNLNSGKQLAELLFTELGIDDTGMKRVRDKSRPILDKKATAKLKDKHEVVRLYREWKERQTLRDNFINALPKSLHPDGKLHPEIQTTRTATRRLAFKNPNLTQMPVRSALGKRVRNAFRPSKGKVYASVDQSQIELRVIAHNSHDSKMIEQFHSTHDFHTQTAALVFRVPIDQVDKDTQRKPAKCFHPDTEVLTQDGWKKIENLIPGQYVMQAIPGENGAVKLEWVKPLEVFTQYHDSKKLIHLRNEGMDLRVTPDHRMLGWTDWGKPFVDTPYKFSTRARSWENSGVWEGGSSDIDLWLLRCAVATQADGSVSQHGSIRFGFTRQRKIDRFRKLFSLAGVPFHAGNTKSYTSFSIHKNDARRILELLDEKKMPWWWLGLPPGHREAILDEARYWDSWIGPRSYRYSSVEEQNADVLQAVASVTGYKSRKVKSDFNRPPARPAYVIAVRDKSGSRAGNLSIDEVEYTDRVACLSVPSGYVLVRDGGVPVVVGQSMNFGVVYGITAEGLLGQFVLNGATDWDLDGCTRLISDWFRVYSGVREYIDLEIRRAKAHLYLWDMWGGVRQFPELLCYDSYVRQGAEREIGNSSTQSGAQGCMQLAMIELWDLIDRERLFLDRRPEPLVQLHDELLFEVHPEVVDDFIGITQAVMNNCVRLEVPIESAAKSGVEWGKLE